MARFCNLAIVKTVEEDIMTKWDRHLTTREITCHGNKMKDSREAVRGSDALTVVFDHGRLP